VIPTKNEENDIRDCLESISRQQFKDLEVIVVDGDSADRTRQVAEELRAKVILERPTMSPANARNIGARAAKGDILLFVDADNVLPENHVKMVLKAFKQGVDAVCTYTKAYKPNRIAKCFFQERAATYPQANDASKMIPNAWRKAVFLDLGGYNPELGYGEDKELNKRALKKGVKKVFCRDIVIYHKEPSTWSRIYKEGRWWGRTLPSYIKTDFKRGTLILIAVLFRAFALPFALIFYFLGMVNVTLFLGLLYILYYLYYLLRSLRENVSTYALIMPLFKSIRNVFISLGLCEAAFKTVFGITYSKGE
jgi:glycosyltransferase involved in cell wall biosynthesis